MPQRVGCKCLEAFVDGIRDPNSSHDCDYVEARNALMPEAARMANQACGGATSSAAWARELHKAMNQLAYERGLIKWPPRPEGVEFAAPTKLKLLQLKKFAD